MKKSIIIFAVGIISLIIFGVLLGARFLSGEDDWICVNSAWIKHGNPSAPVPDKPCAGAEYETSTLKLFFNNNKLDPEFSCNKVFPVERVVLKTQTPARVALELLFSGPFDGEKDGGFFTSINPGVKIQKLSVENGVAKVDFDKQLEYQVGGSCRVGAIRAQIRETLKQFPTVKDVIISIDGRTEDILQP